MAPQLEINRGPAKRKAEEAHLADGWLDEDPEEAGGGEKAREVKACRFVNVFFDVCFIGLIVVLRFF